MTSLKQAIEWVREREGFPPLGVVSVRQLLTQLSLTPPFSIRALLARPLVVDRIHQLYLNLGGRSGTLGYPTSKVEFSGDTATRQYRGGEVQALTTLNVDGSFNVTTKAYKIRETRITFIGFRCIRESDHDQLTPTDEPYFLIAVDTANGIARLKKFGPFSNIETGSEIGVGTILADRFPPNPLSIRVEAFENDQGDPDETARKLQEKLVKLAQQAQSIAAASGADAADGAGVGPSAAAGGVAGVLSGPLGALLAVGAVEALDLGDDWVGQGVTLAFTRPEEEYTPQEMGRFQNIPYNARVEINGGAEGHYEFFFDVAVTGFNPENILPGSAG